MKIILSTINARYIHTALGLRYLYANLGIYQSTAQLCEFTLEQRPHDIVEQLLASDPDVICLGVYIWNVHHTEAVVRLIKALQPQVKVILGGPEVSYEQPLSPIIDKADYVICGWGEASLPLLLETLAQQKVLPEKIIQGKQLPLEKIQFPYFAYTDEDIAHRVIYVEASRGCPFKCEFCLSSLDKTAWAFNIEYFLQELDTLFKRGVRTFKFVDRTFNLKVANSARILQFFLDKIHHYPDEAIFAHFELVPDYLPEALKVLIQAFPRGALQFEIGMQTLNPDVQQRISRRTNLEKAQQNITWLSTQTGVHLHVDLIAGLPGEGLASFAKGLNTLWSWQPQEIQLGILKRLKGTPITRHTETYTYVYDEAAPFAVLQNQDLSFNQLQKLTRLTRFWDLIVNSGRFKQTLPLLLQNQPFEQMWALSDWIYKRTGKTHKIALDSLMKMVFIWLTQTLPEETVQQVMRLDFMEQGIQGWPSYLGVPPEHWKRRIREPRAKAQARQDRHLVFKQQSQ